MNDQLRVLQVTARFLPQVGGVERHVFEVATRLEQMGVTTEVLTTDAGGTLDPVDEVEGVRVTRVPAWPANRDYYAAPGVFGVIGSGDWDVVHVQGIHTLVAPFAMAAAIRADIPFVVTFHTGGNSSQLRTRARPVQWLVLRPLLRRAARLIAVSKFERNLFAGQLKLSRHRFDVIPNGAEIELDRDSLTLGPIDHDLVVAVGRVERYKGHWRLVEALPSLLRVRPGAHLRVVGDGPDRPNLLRRAEELGIADRVEVAPIDTSDRRTLIELLSRAGAFALLSDYEAHGIAVMEAIGLGRPAVVANTTGLREVAEQGWARAIPVDSTPDQIAAALVEALDAPPMDEPALPTWQGAAESLASLYRRLA